MSWLTSIFSKGASTLVDSVGDAVDRLVTSDEDRLRLKNELEVIINANAAESNRHLEAAEREITDRHKTDMASDSWLSKNIRPLCLAVLTSSTILFIWITTYSDLTPTQFATLQEWKPLLVTLLTTVYVFYFTGRTIEKSRTPTAEKM